LINREAKLWKQTVAEQAGFAWEGRLPTNARGDRIETLLPELHGSMDVTNRYAWETDWASARPPLFLPAKHPLQSGIAARIKSHPLRWISGDSHWDAEGIVAHSDRKYLAVCEVWIALFQYSDAALAEIDLHDTAPEKVDTQNPVDRLVTAVAKRVEVESHDRFCKSYTASKSFTR
jgi:hypothetical protein